MYVIGLKRELEKRIKIRLVKLRRYLGCLLKALSGSTLNDSMPSSQTQMPLIIVQQLQGLEEFLYISIFLTKHR